MSRTPAQAADDATKLLERLCIAVEAINTNLSIIYKNGLTTWTGEV